MMVALCERNAVAVARDGCFGRGKSEPAWRKQVNSMDSLEAWKLEFVFEVGELFLAYVGRLVTGEWGRVFAAGAYNRRLERAAESWTELWELWEMFGGERLPPVARCTAVFIVACGIWHRLTER